MSCVKDVWAVESKYIHPINLLFIIMMINEISIICGSFLSTSSAIWDVPTALPIECITITTQIDYDFYARIRQTIRCLCNRCAQYGACVPCEGYPHARMKCLNTKFHCRCCVWGELLRLVWPRAATTALLFDRWLLAAHFVVTIVLWCKAIIPNCIT